MTKKRFALFLIPISICIILCIYFLFLRDAPVEKSYNGFYVNTETKEIVGRCNIKIEGTYEKDSKIEFGKKLSFFSGYLFIDDEKYDLTGNTSLNDNNEYIENAAGENRIGLSTTEKNETIYVFNIYENFNNNDIYIDLRDKNFSDNSSIKIIATTDTATDNEVLDKIR